MEWDRMKTKYNPCNVACGVFKATGYTWLIFHHFLQGRQLFWLPVGIPTHQLPFRRGLMKSKKFTPFGSNFFHFTVDHFSEKNKIVL